MLLSSICPQYRVYVQTNNDDGRTASRKSFFSFPEGMKSEGQSKNRSRHFLRLPHLPYTTMVIVTEKLLNVQTLLDPMNA